MLAAARGGALIEAYTRKRVEAAVLLAEDRNAEAHAVATAGLEALERAQPGIVGEFERDMLRDLLARSTTNMEPSNHGNDPCG
ncbi:MAG: hypothetical protein HC822_06405 [Oscillochloris sp.]|nr:hypothetical protein [Oscillochloris sp.]